MHFLFHIMQTDPFKCYTGHLQVFCLTLNADGLLTPTELNRPTVEVYGHRMYQY